MKATETMPMRDTEEERREKIRRIIREVRAERQASRRPYGEMTEEEKEAFRRRIEGGMDRAMSPRTRRFLDEEMMTPSRYMSPSRSRYMSPRYAETPEMGNMTVRSPRSMTVPMHWEGDRDNWSDYHGNWSDYHDWDYRGGMPMNNMTNYGSRYYDNRYRRY